MNAFLGIKGDIVSCFVLRCNSFWFPSYPFRFDPSNISHGMVMSTTSDLPAWTSE
jgi:hypothetical protein